MVYYPCSLFVLPFILPLSPSRSLLSPQSQVLWIKGGLTGAIPTHLLLTIHDLPATLLPQFHESLDEVQAVSHVEKSKALVCVAQSHPSRSKASGPAKATLGIAFVGAQHTRQFFTFIFVVF